MSLDTDKPADSRSSGLKLNRRHVLTAAGVIGTGLASASAYAAGDKMGERRGKPDRAYRKVMDLANECTATGRICMNHCLTSFQAGDTMLADCAASVYDMLSICDTFAAQLTTGSAYVAGFAVVCRQACEDCEVECRKHARHHSECRDSAEACEKLVKAIDKMMKV